MKNIVYEKSVGSCKLMHLLFYVFYKNEDNTDVERITRLKELFLQFLIGQLS